ncbi:MAG TPA: kynureninase, partial [Nonomuraea sp.]|nr:kynureninase [Nonomuraea sp.]
MLDRDHCLALDAEDPLRDFRDEFVLPEGVVYLVGNSLGALPRRTSERVRQAVEDEWGGQLVGGWNHAGWYDQPL